MTSGLSHQLIVQAEEAAVDKGLKGVIFINQERNLRIGPTLTGCGHRSSHSISRDLSIHGPGYYSLDEPVANLKRSKPLSEEMIRINIGDNARERCTQ